MIKKDSIFQMGFFFLKKKHSNFFLYILQKMKHADMFVTTTIAMVYWTVFVQGITIKPLVKFLNVKVQSEKDPTMNERIAGRFMDHVVAGMEGILGELGNLRYINFVTNFLSVHFTPSKRLSPAK